MNLFPAKTCFETGFATATWPSRTNGFLQAIRKGIWDISRLFSTIEISKPNEKSAPSYMYLETLEKPDREKLERIVRKHGSWAEHEIIGERYLVVGDVLQHPINVGVWPTYQSSLGAYQRHLRQLSQPARL